jgi:DNA repair exonuclease SbcCD ATPase subunit
MGLQDLFNKGPGNGLDRPTVASSTPSHTAGTYHINKAKMDVQTAARKVAAKEGQRDLLLKQRAEAEKRGEAAERQLDVFDKVLILLQLTSDYARQQIKGRIEELVSQALNIVYGGSHTFTIDLVVRSNRPEADYWLNENGVVTQLVKPDYDNGGGKIDVISLTLRLAVDELVGDQGPLFLDEVGKHVDGEAAVNLAYFLKQYAEKFDRQITLITHNTTLGEIGDVSYRVTKVNNEAVIKGVEV